MSTWVVRKNGYSYGPDRRGYTTDIRDAGRYTEEEAKGIASIEPWCMSAHPVSEFLTGYVLTAIVVDEIATERRRQINEEGWTPEHDDKHVSGEMAAAAAAYALHDLAGGWFGRWHSTIWPWSLDRWKPKSRRRDLIRAGALIVAEIERLDRTAAHWSQT